MSRTKFSTFLKDPYPQTWSNMPKNAIDSLRFILQCRFTHTLYQV